MTLKGNNGKSQFRTDEIVLSNPHCEVLKLEDGLLTTDEAVIWLREHGVKQMTTSQLAQRRLYGRIPAFIKIGPLVRYRASALLEFLQMIGLRVRDNEEPQRSDDTPAERLRRERARKAASTATN